MKTTRFHAVRASWRTVKGLYGTNRFNFTAKSLAWRNFFEFQADPEWIISGIVSSSLVGSDACMSRNTYVCRSLGLNNPADGIGVNVTTIVL